MRHIAFNNILNAHRNYMIILRTEGMHSDTVIGNMLQRIDNRKK